MQAETLKEANDASRDDASSDDASSDDAWGRNAMRGAIQCGWQAAILEASGATGRAMGKRDPDWCLRGRRASEHMLGTGPIYTHACMHACLPAVPPPLPAPQQVPQPTAHGPPPPALVRHWRPASVTE